MVETVGEILSFIDSFNKSCQYCGESEQVALMFYPHHRKIRSLNLRHGKKHKAQETNTKVN